MSIYSSSSSMYRGQCASSDYRQCMAEVVLLILVARCVFRARGSLAQKSAGSSPRLSSKSTQRYAPSRGRLDCSERTTPLGLRYAISPRTGRIHAWGPASGSNYTAVTGSIRRAGEVNCCVTTERAETSLRVSAVLDEKKRVGFGSAEFQHYHKC